MELTETHKKAIKALAKADARPTQQMLHMILSEGFNWIFNEVCEMNRPYRGWPDEWKEIEEQLDKEYDEAMNFYGSNPQITSSSPKTIRDQKRKEEGKK